VSQADVQLAMARLDLPLRSYRNRFLRRC